MTRTEIRMAAFPALTAQKFIFMRHPLTNPTQRHHRSESAFEREVVEKLAKLYSEGKTQYRHVLFDSQDGAYVWTGSGFAWVDEDLCVHDEWVEITQDTAETPLDLFCDQLEQLRTRVSFKTALKSHWVIGTYDSLPLEEAVELCLKKEQASMNDYLRVANTSDLFSEDKRERVRKELQTYGYRKTWSVLQYSIVHAQGFTPVPERELN